MRPLRETRLYHRPGAGMAGPTGAAGPGGHMPRGHMGGQPQTVRRDRTARRAWEAGVAAARPALGRTGTRRPQGQSGPRQAATRARGPAAARSRCGCPVRLPGSAGRSETVSAERASTWLGAVTAAWGVKRRTGPSSGLPRRTTQSAAIGIRSIRCSPMKVPFVLPTSSRSHPSPSTRSTACRHETRESSTTMSDLGSRPMRYVLPLCSVCSERLVRTRRSCRSDLLEASVGC